MLLPRTNSSISALKISRSLWGEISLICNMYQVAHFCRLGAVWSASHLLKPAVLVDHADRTTPSRQDELHATDHGCLCSESSRHFQIGNWRAVLGECICFSRFLPVFSPANLEEKQKIRNEKKGRRRLRTPTCYRRNRTVRCRECNAD